MTTLRLWKIVGTRASGEWAIRIRAADYFDAVRKARRRAPYGTRIHTVVLIGE